MPPAQDYALIAEQSLLGAALVNNSAIDAVDGKVCAADFKEPLHQRLWDVFSGARQNGRAIDFKLAVAALGSDAGMEVAPGFSAAQYIARLATEATSVVSCRDYASAIREAADFRRVAAVAADITRHVARPEIAPPAEVARLCIAQLDEIISASTDQGAPQVSAGQAAWEAVNRAVAAKDSGGAVMGVPYGLHKLDDATLGMAAGEMVLMGARPSMGKTAAGLSISLKAALAGRGVMFFSLEMMGSALMERALSDMLYDGRRVVTYRQIRAGQFTGAEEDALAAAAASLDNAPLVIEQEPGLTVGQITARARKQKSKWEMDGGPSLDLVVVDHLHLVRASERYSGDSVSELTEISGALKGLAKDLGVAVLVLCQLNRDSQKREDKRPQLADLRGSGALEQDADVVIFLHREEYYVEREHGLNEGAEAERLAKLDACQNIMEFAIAKQRQGPIKTVRAFANIACNAIRDLAE
ncbi:replicative DNA helicase [Castellaniella sp.]|uniref:replicative DNA helicase n=1 Tax=Castellaniella sp. TaxID=1955812 RepID=UPI002AFF1D4A|nr:DnaB-like helicase C-terminal domain-containing protein [Castellaniella sp.]